MATVYLAQDLKYPREVALKVMRPELAELLGSERFLEEITTSAQLNHPNILPLHDSDATGEWLYFVMPYMAGGTLKDRLEREGPLPLPVAIDLTRQIASGLAFAHEHGVIHRDVKPGNILLAGDHAFIADFGVALRAADRGRLSNIGLAIGTMVYMPPEQARGDAEIDGRSDEFALASVLYEMLVGTPPLMAAATRDVRHPYDSLGQLKDQRPDVPRAVVAAIARALAPDPSQRFPTVADFSAALIGEFVTQPRGWSRRRIATVALAGVAVVVTSALLVTGGQGGPRAGPDTTSYAALPFERDSGIPATFGEQELMRGALLRWTGVSVADLFRVNDAVRRKLTATPLSSSAALDLARSLRAGRYIRGQLRVMRDSVTVHATLYDATRGGAVLGEASERISLDLAGADSAFAALANHLLFRNDPEASAPGFAAGTRSLPARQALTTAKRAIVRWDLPAADSAFALAVRHDPGYARAHLWLGLTRLWSGADSPLWRPAAEQAWSGRAVLDRRDSAMAEALLAVSRGNMAQACAVWASLTRAAPDDFIAWYGSGDCQKSDDAVLRDPRSPSHWRFRSSYHRALLAFRRAFELRPATLVAFRGGGFASVRSLLHTRGNALRSGRALPPDTLSFLAYPSWQGDTLGFVPYPAALASDPSRVVRPATLDDAVRHQRELFHEIALTWAAAAPRSADAREALALSLESLGDPTALDTLRLARTLVGDSAAAWARVASAEVWMLVRLSLPQRPEGLAVARVLADSILVRPMPPRFQDARALAGLAALTGRARLAAGLYRRAAQVEGWGLPPALSQSAPGLLMFAALGGPTDSLAALERDLTSTIEARVDPSDRPALRSEWLGRSATLAFPEFRFAGIAALEGTGDYEVEAQAAFARGDSATVRGILTSVHAARRLVSPADLTLDTLYPEAWLLAALGDSVAAIAWLDPTLGAVGDMQPQVLDDAVQAGALVRAMALRAELAARVGDRAAARKWARSVVALWAGADDFLQPIVQRMQQLAAG